MSFEENKDRRRPVRAGRFFSKEEIKEYRDYFVRSKGGKPELRKAEFFSKNLIEQLLSVEGCDGLRIYYGLAPETEEGKVDAQTGKNRQPRLFLVPVTIGREEDGSPDLEQSRDQEFYVKVDPGKDGEDQFGGAGAGYPCPGFCNP